MILQPLLFLLVPVILLHSFWSDAGAREHSRQLEPTRRKGPLISAETIRQAIERSEVFIELKKAICPKEMSARYDRFEAYPAIDALLSVQYATVTNDPSRGPDKRMIEITPAGRFELMDDLREEPEVYVITIARREYVRGSESLRSIYGDPNVADVNFLWQWQPVNKLGTRFGLGSSGGGYVYRGSATFKMTGAGWTLADLSLEKDKRNFMFAQ